METGIRLFGREASGRLVTPPQRIGMKSSRSFRNPEDWIPIPGEIRRRAEAWFGRLMESELYDISQVSGVDRIIDFLVSWKMFEPWWAYQRQPWLFEAEPEAYSPPKSLLLCGPCGTGKTLMVDLLRPHIGTGGFPASKIRIVEVASAFAEYGMRGLGRVHENVPAIIDDLGAEGDVSYYGNSGMIPAIIEVRYNFFTEFRTPTVITTNLRNAEISERYGERISSRLAEMVTPVFCGGNDRRRANHR
ncbi:MAG: hypothetical protein Q4C47_01630 [Planctomycetia bacterium]|nr:hypothetical protein [Planctomycetia bacterium]